LEASKIDFKVFNTFSHSDSLPSIISIKKNKYLWFLKFIIFSSGDIYHLYSPNWIVRITFGIMSKIKKGIFIISIHGNSISVALEGQNAFKTKLTKWMLKSMDLIISCNQTIMDDCIIKAGVSLENMVLIPAFIPDEDSQNLPLPKYIEKFQNNYSPIIFCVGWVGKIFKGNDIYGIDMALKLIQNLKTQFNNIGLIISINGGNEEKISDLVNNVKPEIKNNTLFILEELPNLKNIFLKSDVFIRPTNTDGDSVSVQEAIYYGTTAIASDAVPRPEECIVFKTRDLDDLILKTGLALGETVNNQKSTVKKIKPNKNNGDLIIDIYKGYLRI
jgi:glycosyltransferase involved in cell wall biosynthesis